MEFQYMKAVCLISVGNALLEVEFLVYEISMEYTSYNKNCSLTWFHCEKWLEEMAHTQYTAFKNGSLLVTEVHLEWTILILQLKPSLLASALINTQRASLPIL